MADSLFEVKYGLKVGNTIIYAGNGDVTAGGNITVTGNVAVSAIQNGNSNVRVAANGNVTVSAIGTANVVTVTATGANISGTANITGNANVGNLGTSGLVTAGNLTAGNITISGDTISSANATITIDPSTSGVGGTVIVAGNLQVTGTTTTIDSTVITTNDLSITLANNAATAAAANGAGLSVNGASTFFRYESTPNSWVIDRSFIPNANATLSLGATGSRWANIWGLASSAQYADLAERYDAGIYIEPGTVVEFGGDNEVQVCGTHMSTKVAGVVSTAPGYLMNDTADKDATWVAVALQGRVPTKVVGPVAKGDMMVSAGNGHAMACSAPIVGSVIGKALENFAEGEGVIEVVVGRV